MDDNLNGIYTTGRKRKKNNIFKKIIIIMIILSLLVAISYLGYQYYLKLEYEKTYEFKLLTHGYDIETVYVLEENFDDEQLNEMLERDVIVGITNLIEAEYFIYDNLDRYETNYDYTDINFDVDYMVRKINVNADISQYVDSTAANTDLELNLLVNKYYYLEEEYIPDNLVQIGYSYTFTEEYVNEEAYEAYKLMYEAALEDDILFLITSAYRSYDYQQEVYDDYVETYGEDYAKEYVAVAGYSEHQTGLALDIFTYGSTMATFETTEGYEWLCNNSYKYGFILRYPEDKVELTGATFESWHYRYVGVEIAKQIYEEGITFEEYYAYYVENK